MITKGHSNLRKVGYVELHKMGGVPFISVDADGCYLGLGVIFGV